jgi:hypothetical protein
MTCLWIWLNTISLLMYFQISKVTEVHTLIHYKQVPGKSNLTWTISSPSALSDLKKYPKESLSLLYWLDRKFPITMVIFELRTDTDGDEWKSSSTKSPDTHSCSQVALLLQALLVYLCSAAGKWYLYSCTRKEKVQALTPIDVSRAKAPSLLCFHFYLRHHIVNIEKKDRIC